MPLDLSTGTLIRSGSYVVLLAVAAVLYTRRRAHPWNTRIALAYCFSAASGIAFSLLGANANDAEDLDPGLVPWFYAITAVCSLAAAVTWWPIVRQLRAALDTGGRRWADVHLTLAVTLGLLGAGAAVVELTGLARLGVLEGSAYRSLLLAVLGTGLVAAAEGRRRDQGDRREQLVFWVAAFPFVMEALVYAGTVVQEPPYPGRAVGALVLASAVGMRLAFTLWGLRALKTRADRWYTVLMLSALAGGACGALVELQTLEGTGTSGIILLLADLVALGLLWRLGSLGTFKGSGLRAASIAPIGLGALFITAQVAQNFLSDKYGLYVGGVVAGAVVFATFPLQRAAERATERSLDAGRRSPGRAVGPLAVYRRQVETAWLDGKLGANERVMLLELRKSLGLSSEDAESVDVDVAARHAVDRRVRPRGRP